MRNKQWLPNDETNEELVNLRAEIKRLRKFKEYFDDLYGQGLEVKNWHLNGETEPFDNFYELATSSLQPIKKEVIAPLDDDFSFLKNPKSNEYKSVWANALLSDGKILFWYVGSECKSKLDFYKDFYFAGIGYMDYEAQHQLKLVKKEFRYKNGEQKSNYIFNVLAPEYFRNYEISPDSKGSPPY